MTCGNKCTCGENAFMIPHINVIQLTLASDDNVSAWMEQSQHHHGVIYNLDAPSTKYASCVCKWALCGNVCKHQIVVLMTCTNLTPNNIIVYCGTWYGTN
jgi:hypothetical protein